MIAGISLNNIALILITEVFTITDNKLCLNNFSIYVFATVIKNEVSTGRIRYVIKTLFPSFLERGIFMRWNYFFAPSQIKFDGFTVSA